MDGCCAMPDSGVCAFWENPYDNIFGLIEHKNLGCQWKNGQGYC